MSILCPGVATDLCGVLCCDHLPPDERVPPSLNSSSFLTCDLPANHASPAGGGKHSCSACRRMNERRRHRSDT